MVTSQWNGIKSSNCSCSPATAVAVLAAGVAGLVAGRSINKEIMFLVFFEEYVSEWEDFSVGRLVGTDDSWISAGHQNTFFLNYPIMFEIPTQVQNVSDNIRTNEQSTSSIPHPRISFMQILIFKNLALCFIFNFILSLSRNDLWHHANFR